MPGEAQLLDVPGTVLAVDDQAFNLELVDEILSSEGFVVQTATDGASALVQVARRAPDCIVLDVMMPGLDGLEVCRRLKRNRETRSIPVVMLTALTDVDDKVAGLEAGADDFLNKPVDRQELIARVRSLVKVKRLYDELDTSENIIFSMASALESKHPRSKGQTDRVVAGAVRLAHALGAPPLELDVVAKAAHLHDLGKIGVPERILEVDGPLSDEDEVLLRGHPEMGERILEPLRSFEEIRRVVRHHHERLDGSGYPDHISGEKFTRATEVLALCNFYDDAMTSSSPAAALETLRQAAAAGQFRRRTVEAFIELQSAPEADYLALLPGQLPRTGRILVADDSSANRDMLSEILGQSGHQVECVESGPALLAAVEAKKPDLVIVDVRMPGLNGFSVCRALKAKPETEFLPIILVTAAREIEDRKRGVAAGADDFLTVPLHRYELVARVHSLLRLHHYFQDLEEHQAVILSLATALEAKDRYTRGHSERVGQYAVKLAREMALPDADCELMRVAGLLHDIGKIGIPERLLNKPGKLTEAEFQTIMTHPPRGEVICRPLRTVQQALPLIRHHHERYNGRGYPDHLKGDEIPLGARVLSLADAWDALTSERSYRKTLSSDEALQILRRETGEGLWDPRIFTALERMILRDAPTA